MIKKHKIISIILIILLILVSIFFKIIYNNASNPKNGLLIGNIVDRKITKDEQYLTIKDLKNNDWKIILDNNTIFKQKLNLETGDKIRIQGKINNENLFSATEISK